MGVFKEQRDVESTSQATYNLDSKRQYACARSRMPSATFPAAGTCVSGANAFHLAFRGLMHLLGI
jgi:hypothetical protein